MTEDDPLGTASTRRVRRSSITLFDGRSLHYYDDSEPYASGARDRESADPRPAGPPAPRAPMRFDVLTGEWIVMAAHRMDRTHLPPADLCPLCPARPGREPGEIPSDDYDVVVFENRFPSFVGPPDEPVAALDGEPLWEVRPASGACEVICFTSDHEAAFASLSHDRVRTVIEAWADRTADLSERAGVEQVFVFENRGREIGVTLHHPHGQIYAYPYVTPRTIALLWRAERYAVETGRSLLADVLAAERRAGTRIVRESAHWTSYVPAAARWPVEVHLAPHRDVPDLAALNADERDDLAVVYLDLLRRLDRFFPGVDRLPYIAGWHQAPVRDRRALGRLHLQAFSIMRAPGKLKYLAGSESGMGAWVNDTTPERIAARLREVGG